MVNYEQLESDLSNLLQGQFFDCKPLPDMEAEYKPSFKPIAYVMFDSSDYIETENLSAIVQEDKFKIGFEINSRTRRGTEGIFAIQRIIYNKILGLKLPGLDRLQLQSFTPLAGNSPNHWMYYIQFTTVGHVSQADPESDEPLLKQVTFIPKDE